MATVARPRVSANGMLVLLLGAAVFLNYVDRGAIGIAAPLMKQDLSFPGSSKIIARHLPAERRGIANAAVAMGIALGPAVGTLAGGLIVAGWGWRAMFVVFGVLTLLWLLPWQHLTGSLSAHADSDAKRQVPLGILLRKWPLWSISIVHALGNYCFYFLLAWLPLFLVQSRGFTIPQMALLASLGFAVQGACAFAFGHISDWWTRSGRSEAACRRTMMVISQSLAAFAILGLAFAHDAMSIAILLCLAGAASASLSMNLYAIGQMFAGRRAAGTWVGVQNAIGNTSGIFGPVVTGIVVQRSGYEAAFYLTAAVAAVGAVWWLVAVPAIRQVNLEG